MLLFGPKNGASSLPIAHLVPRYLLCRLYPISPISHKKWWLWQLTDSLRYFPISLDVLPWPLRWNMACRAISCIYETLDETMYQSKGQSQRHKVEEYFISITTTTDWELVQEWRQNCRGFTISSFNSSLYPSKEVLDNPHLFSVNCNLFE